MPTPFVLLATEVVEVEPAVDPPPVGTTPTVQHIVSPSVPVPALVNGRPV